MIKRARNHHGSFAKAVYHGSVRARTTVPSGAVSGE